MKATCRGILLLVATAAAAWAAPAAAFDLPLAYEAMWRTKPCACGTERVNAWNCTPCTAMPFAPPAPGSTFAFRNTSGLNAQFYVNYVPADDAVWLAFRGTEGLAEWIENADFALVPYAWCADGNATGCAVHAGFLTVYQTINATVFAHTAALLATYPTAKLRVAGHSLGAALATHAAVQLATAMATGRLPWRSTRLVSLHTIGSPRVGNPAFVRWAAGVLGRAGAASVRMTHNADIVPKLPLLEMGYLHLPHEVWFPHGHEETEPLFNASSPLVAHVTCEDSAEAEDWTRCSNTIPVQHAVLKDHTYLMGEHLSCNNGQS